MSKQTTKTSKANTDHSDTVSSFIQKSYQLLEDQKFTDIVDWNDKGTAIVIKNPVEFGHTVLPKYFKHSNLTSFVRQLNMYNFRKRRSESYDHVYYHSLFQCGQRHLLKEIKRKIQDNTLNNVQKAIENLKSMQDDKDSKQTVHTCENQLLKKLNKEAFGKIESLESRIKELTAQNQSLKTKANHQNKKEDMLISFVSEFLKRKGISFDELPKILDSELEIPALNLLDKTETVKSEATEYKGEDFSSTDDKPQKFTNVEDFFCFSEGESNSTELPSCSPQTKTRFECSMFNIEGLKYESEDWRFQSIQNINGQQLGKRTLDRDDYEFEGLEKMVKMEASPYLNDFEPKLENINDFSDMFSGMDQFPYNGVDLMSFN